MASSNNNVLEKIASLKQTLLAEGLLNNEFLQLESLQDENNPNFVEEMYAAFFEDMNTAIVPKISETLDKTPVDFTQLDRLLHKLKGSSSSIGANKVWIKVNQMRDQCAIGSADGMKALLKQLITETADTKSKLEVYFEASRDRANAGSAETAAPAK